MDAFITSLIGTPFRYGGRHPDDALDCYGLLLTLYKARQNITLPDYVSPSDSARINALMNAQLHLWDQLETPRPDCTLLFRLPGQLHVGYYLGRNQFIHTLEKAGGVCLESLPLWRRQLVGAYQFKDSNAP